MSQIIKNDRRSDANRVTQIWLLVHDLGDGEHSLDHADTRFDLGLVGFRRVVGGVFSKVLVDAGLV